MTNNIDRVGEYVVHPTVHDKYCHVGISGEFIFNNCECYYATVRSNLEQCEGQQSLFTNAELLIDKVEEIKKLVLDMINPYFNKKN